MSGIKRQIDKLGRVVIPVNYRNHLQLTENSSVNISLESNSIIITPDRKCCSICGTTSQVHDNIPICEKCIKTIKKLP